MENKYKYIWVGGIFLTLITILIMVMTYKIKYEDSIYYRYLYFYDCNSDLCSTTKHKKIKDKSKIFSVYKYIRKEPTIRKLNNKYVMVHDNDGYVLFDYIESKVISKKYKDYEVIENENVLFIASNNESKYGIINNEGNQMVGFNYEFIKNSYNKNMIVVKKDGKYGIISLSTQYQVFDNIYDDLYIFEDAIVSIKDNKLEIIDKDKKPFENRVIEVNNLDGINVSFENNVINIKINNNDNFDEYKFDVTVKRFI